MSDRLLHPTGARDILGENHTRRSRLTRRSLLSLSVVPAAKLCAQSRAGGMASRGVKPLPRGKPSGIPFQARFVDVGEKAGLSNVVVSGHADRADYVIEAMSCGVAFLDYDNDGWLDILALSG